MDGITKKDLKWKVVEVVVEGRLLTIATNGDLLRIRGHYIKPLEVEMVQCLSDEIVPRRYLLEDG